MYLLDTMVPSELRKGRRANPGVLTWTHATPDHVRYISVASIVEWRRGALQLENKDPQQSIAIHHWLDHVILAGFQSRVLPITQAIAEWAALLHVPSAREAIDMFIAATALEHDLILVTRNERHFRPTGVKLFNPFT